MSFQRTLSLRRTLLTLVCILALLAPVTTWASDSPAGPVTLWQSLGQIWQSWTSGWIGTPEDEVDTGSSAESLLETAASSSESGSTDSEISDSDGTTTVAPPTLESLGLNGDDEPETEEPPKIDPVG